MDGFVNIGDIHHCHGGSVLLDRRMGLRHLAVFSIHYVSHDWIRRRCSGKRGGKVYYPFRFYCKNKCSRNLVPRVYSAFKMAAGHLESGVDPGNEVGALVWRCTL